MKFEDRRYVCVAGCLVVMLLFVVQFMPLCFAVGFDEAAEAVERAERDSGLAFVAVAEAASAGANVTVLLDKLEVAGGFVSEANAAFRVGDYESALSSAVACSRAVEGVVGDAARLKAAAELSHNASLTLNLAGFFIGVAVFLVCAFIGWVFLKRRYLRRVLDMKPKVENVQ